MSGNKKELKTDHSNEKIRGRPYIPFENASGDEAQAAKESEKSLSRWSLLIKIISYFIIIFGILDLLNTCFFLISFGFFNDFSITLGSNHKFIIDFNFAKPKCMISVSFGILFGITLIYQGLSGVKASQRNTQEEASKHLRKTFLCFVLYTLLFLCKSFYDLNSLHQTSSDIKNTIYEFPHSFEKELERIYEKHSNFPYLIFQYPNGSKFGHAIFKNPDCFYSEIYLQSLHKQEIFLNQNMQKADEAFIPALKIEQKLNIIDNLENDSNLEIKEVDRGNAETISNFEGPKSKGKNTEVSVGENEIDFRKFEESGSESNKNLRILDETLIEHYNIFNMMIMCKQETHLQFSFNMWTIKVYIIPILYCIIILSILIYMAIFLCCCRCVNKCNKIYERTVTLHNYNMRNLQLNYTPQMVSEKLQDLPNKKN